MSSFCFRTKLSFTQKFCKTQFTRTQSLGILLNSDNEYPLPVSSENTCSFRHIQIYYLVGICKNNNIWFSVHETYSDIPEGTDIRAVRKSPLTAENLSPGRFHFLLGTVSNQNFRNVLFSFI